MNAGTLDRLRTHVLPGVRGARTLLYNLGLSLDAAEIYIAGSVDQAANDADQRTVADLGQRVASIERDLLRLLHSARAERNAKVAKPRRTG